MRTVDRSDHLGLIEKLYVNNMLSIHTECACACVSMPETFHMLAEAFDFIYDMHVCKRGYLFLSSFLSRPDLYLSHSFATFEHFILMSRQPYDDIQLHLCVMHGHYHRTAMKKNKIQFLIVEMEICLVRNIISDKEVESESVRFGSTVGFEFTTNYNRARRKLTTK